MDDPGRSIVNVAVNRLRGPPINPDLGRRQCISQRMADRKLTLACVQKGPQYGINRARRGSPIESRDTRTEATQQAASKGHFRRGPGLNHRNA